MRVLEPALHADRHWIVKTIVLLLIDVLRIEGRRGLRTRASNVRVMGTAAPCLILSAAGLLLARLGEADGEGAVIPRAVRTRLPALHGLRARPLLGAPPRAVPHRLERVPSAGEVASPAVPPALQRSGEVLVARPVLPDLTSLEVAASSSTRAVGGHTGGVVLHAIPPLPLVPS